MKDSGTLSKLNRWWHSVQTKSTLAILITAGVLIETTAAVQYWFAREGIRKEVEGAGHTLALLEKYTDKAQLLAAVADADALIIRSDKVDAEVLDAWRYMPLSTIVP